MKQSILTVSVFLVSVINSKWTTSDLTQESVGMWEPTYDPVAWEKIHELHLFVQNVGQGDAEGIEDIPAQMISVLEWRATGGQ